jgi:hypothetical protein
VCSGETVKTTESKVVFLDNSHFKESVPRTGNYLGAKFEVSGLVKPGAGFEKTVGKSIMDSFKLRKKDVLVLSGGVNYVYNNNSIKVILLIVKFLQDNDNANKIMLDVLHRYALSDNSYVNKEIKAFNSQLKKIADIF